jgi:dolichol-phosphate mannosyltransferase
VTPRVSVVVPAFMEGAAIVPFLDRVLEAITLPAEVLVVYDAIGDSTVPFLRAYAERDARLRPLHNTFAGGPANALRYGIDHAAADVVVVTMADGSDDPMQIDQLTRLVERGVVVACASRYMRGGQQVGGPWLKGRISRVAGVSLNLIGRVGTHDATNSFKAYSRAFVQRVGIDSDAGFELGIEMVAKARRLGLPVAELPTIWLDRADGTSNFKVKAWIPRYLHWYLYALGLKREKAVGVKLGTPRGPL